MIYYKMISFRNKHLEAKNQQNDKLAAEKHNTEMINRIKMERIRREYEPSSPFNAITTTAGMIASIRVISRRRTGRILN